MDEMDGCIFGCVYILEGGIGWVDGRMYLVLEGSDPGGAALEEEGGHAVHVAEGDHHGGAEGDGAGCYRDREEERGRGSVGWECRCGCV
jgi:hypothetical protein